VAALSGGLNTDRVYIRRQGRMTRAQARALIELMPRYSVPLSESVGDWATVFERHAPLALEVGFGMGHALLDAAQRHPQWNWLGIEVYRPGIGALLNGVVAAGLTNVRIVEADARRVLAQMIESDSLRRLVVLFPDPWPKSKHHKRRLISVEFAALAASRLAVDGDLLLATDWADYAEQMLAVLDAEPGLRNCAGAGCYAPRSDERRQTRFEARGVSLGHRVWDLAYRRAREIR
jgi:tRNA (guanine-N7-)-methyltransferase